MRTEQLIVSFGISAALLSTIVPVVGQGREVPARLPDGQPNVQGIYGPVNAGSTSLTNPISGGADFERRVTGVEPHVPSRIIDPPDGLLPYQPWAAARQKQQGKDYDHPTKPEDIDPQHRCLISGVPRLYTVVPAVTIMQPPGSVVFIWDEYHAYRVIPLDGRPHVGPNLKLWMGDARGHWEGNTLHIDTTNVRGARLDYIGDFYSENAYIVERLTVVDAATMNYEATVDDPTVFTRPWTMRVVDKRRREEEMWETACFEGNMPPDSWLLKTDTKPR